MRGRTAWIRRIRPEAAAVQTALWLLAGVLAPVGHLATHLPDHTHGPELVEPWDHDEQDRHHDEGGHVGHPGRRDHDRDDHDDVAVSDGHQDRPRHEADDTGHVPATRLAPRRHHSPFDHGHDSIAHLSIAVTGAPPVPLLPPPAVTTAPARDDFVRGHRAPALPQPPARGPPA